MRAAAAISVMCVAVTAVSAAPAYADGRIAVSVSPASGDVRTGEDGTAFTVDLKNADIRDAKNVTATVAQSGLDGYVDVAAEGCDKVDGLTVTCGNIERLKSKSFTVTVTGKSDTDLGEGQTKTGKITVTVSSPNNTSGEATVNVIGTKQVANGISGTVKDVYNEKPVKGVEVSAKDSKGTDWGPATTGKDGTFNIPGDIPLGKVTISYKKDGYEEDEKEATANNGEPVSGNTLLTPTGEGKDAAAPEQEQEEASAQAGGLGGTGWTIVVLGGLLVAGGIAAIVLLVRRGKKDDDDDDNEEESDTPSIYRPAATQTGQLGVYDAVTRRPGMDSPTMLHNGPLVTDDDLAAYGSEPVSGGAAGFGPAYGESGNRPTEQVDPSASGTRKFPAADGGTDWGEQRAAEPGPAAAPGFGAAYGSEPSGTGYGSEPSYGGQRGGADSAYGQGSEPSYGGQRSYGSEPSYGGQQRGGSGYSQGSEPSYGGQRGGADSAYGQGSEPSYGGQRSYGSEPSSTGYGSEPSYGGQQRGGSGYGQGSEPSYGGQRSYGSEPSYGGQRGADGSVSGWGESRDGQAGNAWGAEETPRQRARHYRDDEDEDRPRSW